MLRANRPSIVRVARPLIGARNPPPGPPIPDLLLDFETGAGLPLSAGGAGGLGSDLVQVTTPQDSGGNTRLVRALRYWSPTAHWKQGEPIFVPKQAGRLVGWPGPREGGYWSGPIPSLSSPSEVVAVYASGAGITVTTVAGGVVGSDALRCDVAAGQSGDGWSALPAATLTSGWTVASNGTGTVCYLHAVVELLGNISDHRFVFGLYDSGASAFVEQLTQRYDAADTQRSGKVYRGIGPHGGHLYEIWALARLISAPVGPLSAPAYLLSSGSGGNPARTVIIHGCQSYFFQYYIDFGLSGVPPFFSYARGAAVAWTNEEIRLLDVTGAYSAAVKFCSIMFASGAPYSHGRLFSRNSVWNEGWYHYQPTSIRSSTPYWDIPGFTGRIALRVASNYARALSMDGVSILTAAAFDTPAANPSYLAFGSWPPNVVTYGRHDRLLFWRRALSDDELLRAFRQLGEPLL